MDETARREEQDRLEKNRRRRQNYCVACGGTLDSEREHPLGPPLVSLQCSTCGNEQVFVKSPGGNYSRPGGGRR